MPQRPCLDCRRLTRNPSRCTSCQSAWQAKRGTATQRGYGSQWARTSRAAVAAHRAQYGDTCPGWDVPAHHATDLTGDHIVALANGGTNDPANVQVLCRACNSRKHSSH